MELKKFRNKYDLELIPASHQNIILGTLVWDPLIGKPKFEHKGMPENIYNAFFDADLIKESKWKKFIDDIKLEKIVDAQLAESSVNIDTTVATTLENPTIGKIQNNFEMEKVSKYSFGDIQVRTMSNLTRIRIDNYLEILKINNWDKYDGRIRRVFMITELYYGSIKLITKTDWKNDLDASISQSDLSLKNTIDFGKSVEYTFNHNNVPFAMRIEKVKEFNG
jgi:hypothetical protein